MTKTIRQFCLAALSASALTACGGGGSDSNASNNPSANPTPSISPIVTFGAAPAQDMPMGSEFSISWQSSNASACEASGSWTGEKAVSGSEMLLVSEVGEKTYTMTCSGDGGSASDSLEVTVVNLPTLSFESSAIETSAGSVFKLLWESTDTTGCTASGDWSGDMPTSGSEELVETSVGEKRYKLTCSGLGGDTSETVGVTVLNSPVINIEATSYAVPADTEFSINWSVTGADSCFATGSWAGNKTPVGKESFVESEIITNTYGIECTGKGGVSSDSVSVVITNPLTLSVSALKSAPAGVDFIISWSSTDADTCTADGDWSGDKPTQGSETVNVDSSGENSYFLTCSGTRGNVEDVATVDVFDYNVDKYHGTQTPDFVDDEPENVEYFESTVVTAGQLEGLEHEQTAEFGAGKFVFNRVYRAIKHGMAYDQQFGIFGSWLHSYDNNSIEGGLWVNPKTTGPQYYPSLHLAGIGDTYYACNDVTMGGGLYEKVLGDRWLTQFQISNQVLSVPGMNIGFDMHQDNHPIDNGIWVGSGWSYLNLDHPRDYKFWLSFVETYDYQGPISGYIPEHFNWVDPEKVEEGSYEARKAAAEYFGTFADLGSSPNGGNGNERVSQLASALADDVYYVPTDYLPIEKAREYLLAFPQSIEQSTMEIYSEALKGDALDNTLIAADVKNFQSVYKSTHNQLKLVEEVAGEEHLHIVVPSYNVGYSESVGFVDWDFSSESNKAKLQEENGYIYVRKLDEKWQVEEFAGDEYRNHPHIYQTELVDKPDSVIRAPKVDYKFYNYKERDTSNPEFANWNTEGMKRYQVLLQNGAIATYVWFKFIEQPALKTAQQNHPEVYTDEYLATLQSYVEKLHTKVHQSSVVNPEEPIFLNYSEIPDADSTEFNLAKIDPGQLVSPEPQKMVGYVPVVISVYHPEEYSANGMGLEAEPDAVCANDEWTDTYHPDIE